MTLGIVEQVAKIWKAENRVSSDGVVKTVNILGLDEKALELFGQLIRVDGRTKLNGLFSYTPYSGDRKITQDGFDQTQLYTSLYGVISHLKSLGIDVPSIISSRHGGKTHAVTAHANAVPDLNAWYSPQKDDITFGTFGDMSKGEDKWHLAADGDIAVHEFGHLILDHINKRLGMWSDDSPVIDEDVKARSEGRAIHEGFGDALAALYSDDPEVSEDFPASMGKPDNKTEGLRTADHNLTLDDVSWEEHDRGQIYAGFFWSIKEALTEPNGPFKLNSRDAADLTLKILQNHAAAYSTGYPEPADVVKAVLLGIDAMATTPALTVNKDNLKRTVMAEARKRKLIKDGLPPDTNIYRPPQDFASTIDRSTKLVLDQRTAFLGGVQEIYQQQYRTSKGDHLNVVGHGVIVEKNQAGRTILISAKDRRYIKEGDIDETVTLSVETAKTIALAHAHKTLFEAKQKINAFRSDRTKLAASQLDYRVAESSVNVLGQPSFAPSQAKLVILPRSNDLHFEMKTGMGTYYVNAKTGEIKFCKDIFAD